MIIVQTWLPAFHSFHTYIIAPPLLNTCVWHRCLVEYIPRKYLLTFDTKCNETELCGVSLVLLQSETPPLPFLSFHLSFFIFHRLLYIFWWYQCFQKWVIIVPPGATGATTTTTTTTIPTGDFFWFHGYPRDWQSCLDAHLYHLESSI